ncbi:MAG: hypothetical protein VW397_04155, partial [Candidatus Margulisiibacteriota bacterium]
MVIICVALEKELPSSFKQKHSIYWTRLRELKSGSVEKFKHLPFLIVITGVGKSTHISWLIDQFSPIEIINIGTAGSTSLNKAVWC